MSNLWIYSAKIEELESNYKASFHCRQLVYEDTINILASEHKLSMLQLLDTLTNVLLTNGRDLILLHAEDKTLVD